MIMTWFCRFIMTGFLLSQSPRRPGFTQHLFTSGLLVIINGLFDWLLDTFGGCYVSRVLQPSLAGTALSFTISYATMEMTSSNFSSALEKNHNPHPKKRKSKVTPDKTIVSSDVTSFTCIITTEAVETWKTCPQHDSSYCSQRHPSADVNPAFLTPMKD